MRCILTFGCGLVAGASIWLLSPLVTDRYEPWDARLWYFVSALIMMGLAAGLLSLRRHFWLAILGLYCGQAAILFARPPSGAEQAPWWAGALLLGAFTTIAIVTGLIVIFGRWLLRRIRRPEPKV